MNILTLDFETKAIEDWRAPEPVSFAAIAGAGKEHWYAWGHPEGNNCTFSDARWVLRDLLADHYAVLCHNAPFDIGVLRTHFDLNPFARHDTQVLAFLVDPYSKTLGLKPLAERYLGEPPEERDAVRDWLIEHKIVRASASKAWGAHIADAPADVVKPYCLGDVRRTRKLFDLWRDVAQGEAYKREMKLQTITDEMTFAGVVLDQQKVQEDLALYEGILSRTQREVADRLSVEPFDFEDRTALADAVESRFGIELPRTDNGRRRTAKDVVQEVIPDPLLRGLLRYESALRYDLKNYLRPWSKAGERLHVQWRTTASDAGGARTGRLSSSPNFQNLKSTENEEKLVASLKEDGIHSPLPAIRSYVVAPEGQKLVGGDYSQIELRMAAYYEDGEIAKAYQANPALDLHQWAAELVTEYGVEMSRKQAKTIGFGILYGSGGAGVAKTMGVDVAAGTALRDAYLSAMPGLRDLMREVQRKGRTITTLGGRKYKAEPGYEYKLLNYLIQGGAADLMKEAMIAAYDAGLDLVLSVHDEAVVYAEDTDEAQATLREAMLDNALARKLAADVPLLVDTYVVDKWSEAK